MRDTSGLIVKDIDGWHKINRDITVTSRESLIDKRLLEALKPLLSNSDPEIRARASYSIGELGGDQRLSLLETAMKNEKDQNVLKTLKYAIQRSSGKVGPF